MRKTRAFFFLLLSALRNFIYSSYTRCPFQFGFMNYFFYGLLGYCFLLKPFTLFLSFFTLLQFIHPFECCASGIFIAPIILCAFYTLRSITGIYRENCDTNYSTSAGINNFASNTLVFIEISTSDVFMILLNRLINYWLKLTHCKKMQEKFT